MTVKKVWIAISLCVAMIPGVVSAQDTHFSQFNYDPLALNPALAGLTTCDYRVVLNARTQWGSVSGLGAAYNSFGASADFAVGKVTKFNGFAGIGIALNTDLAGATMYNTNRADLTAAYHFSMDRRSNTSISVGLDVAFNHRGFDPSKSTYDDQYNPLTGRRDPSLPGETFARTNMIYVDAGAGVFFSQFFHQKRDNLYLGIAVSHVNQPDISWNTTGLYNTSGGSKLYEKTTIHGGGIIDVSDKFAIMPSFMILIQGPSQEYNFGSLFRFKVGNKISTTYFYAGAQFRAPYDALILQARMDYKRVQVGFSYDVNVSGLVPGSNTIGAPELSFIYQGCFNPPPSHRGKTRPYMCPVM